MRATFETCMQETRCHNLNCGDQDSVGAFQQRPSMGWGTAEQCMDVTFATNSFLAQAIPLAAANPGATPDQIAQGVQRAELGNLYAQHFDTANRLIQQAADRTGVAWNGINPSGGGGGGNNPPPSGGGGSGDCQKYTVVSGDYCSLIGQKFGIDVGAFLSWNPSVNSGCTNLQPGTAYCVSPPSSPPPSGGGGSGSCQKYTAVSGDYCSLIAQKFGIDVGSFMSWNPSINSGCTNLQPGAAYCVTRP